MSIHKWHDIGQSKRIHQKNPKKTKTSKQKTLPELINTFSKVEGYKRSIYKIKLCFYTSAINEQAKEEIKKIILFIIASKRIKYLGINITKKVKDLYTKNYKTMLKEIKEDLNKCKDIPCSLIERHNIGKMSMILKAIYIFYAIPAKVPTAFFAEMEMPTLKSIHKCRGPKEPKTILSTT